MKKVFRVFLSLVIILSVLSIVGVQSASAQDLSKPENAVSRIDGEFVEAGEILTYTIYYYNHTGREVTVEIIDTIPAHTSYLEGSASHGGKYVDGKVDWILTLSKGRSVTVQFSVVVDESDLVEPNAATILGGCNTYTINTVNSHSVEDIVKKEVLSGDNANVNLDGEKVYGGEHLIYTVNYTNNSSDTVKAVIIDQVPEHTTYVEGSANNGGKYEDGTITWEIENIKPFTTVTVMFVVTVDDLAESAVISNLAEVLVGENIYVTNEVTNEIEVLEEAELEPFAISEESGTVEAFAAADEPEETEVSKTNETAEVLKVDAEEDSKDGQIVENSNSSENPKTGDYLHVAIIFVLGIVSGGVLVALQVCKTFKSTANK